MGIPPRDRVSLLLAACACALPFLWFASPGVRRPSTIADVPRPPGAPPPAEIRLSLRDPDGTRVDFAEAEILAAVWGGTKRIPLRPTGDELRLSRPQLVSLLAAHFSRGL